MSFLIILVTSLDLLSITVKTIRDKISFLCTHISYDMKRYILSIIALVLFATTFYAQEQTAAATNDSVPALTKKELRKQKVARRNLHYNILGGPSYTPRLRCRAGRKRPNDLPYEPQRHHAAALRSAHGHRLHVQRWHQSLLQTATLL